ncbi:MAG TPA: nitrite reductase small subunit NirD [Rhizorhapis sp.]|nr:nitrite reductase small subunit NirD [Rhizorhapis sp.]
MTPDWIDIGAVDDVPLRGARTVPVWDSEEIAVFRTGEGEVYALVNKCPHKQGPLSQGIVHGDKVACPLHNWNISLKTGEALGPDEGCVPTIPVQVVDGRIMIARAEVMSVAA